MALELVGPNGSKLSGGKLLGGRQLTITLDQQHHSFLADIANANKVSVHDAALSLLQAVIVEEHMALRRLKFVWLLNNWMTWGLVNA